MSGILAEQRGGMHVDLCLSTDQNIASDGYTMRLAMQLKGLGLMLIETGGFPAETFAVFVQLHGVKVQERLTSLAV